MNPEWSSSFFGPSLPSVYTGGFKFLLGTPEAVNQHLLIYNSWRKLLKSVNNLRKNGKKYLNICYKVDEGKKQVKLSKEQIKSV